MVPSHFTCRVLPQMLFQRMKQWMLGMILVLALGATFMVYKRNNASSSPSRTSGESDAELVDEDQDPTQLRQVERERIAEERAEERARQKAALAAGKAAKAEQRRREKEAKEAKKVEKRLADSTQARASYVGTALPILAAKGATYRSVKISDVTATDMTIFHSKGAITIPLNELPLSVKSSIQYHEKDYLNALAKTHTARKKPDAQNRAAANVAASSGSTPTADVAKATPVDSHDAFITALEKELDTKSAALSKLDTTIFERTTTMRGMSTKMNASLVDNNDRARWAKMAQNIAELTRKASTLRGETEGIRVVMMANPADYAALKDQYDTMRKLKEAYHIADGDLIAARTLYGQQSEAQSYSRIKSHKADEQIAKYKKLLATMEARYRTVADELSVHQRLLDRAMAKLRR